MAFVKGQGKTGGRVKGAPNKVQKAIADQLAELGCDPIAGMARIAAISMEAEDYATAGTMYKELAQYVAAKRKSIEFSGDIGLDLLGDVMIGFRDMPVDIDID